MTLLPIIQQLPTEISASLLTQAEELRSMLRRKDWPSMTSYFKRSEESEQRYFVTIAVMKALLSEDVQPFFDLFNTEDSPSINPTDCRGSDQYAVHHLLLFSERATSGYKNFSSQADLSKLLLAFTINNAAFWQILLHHCSKRSLTPDELASIGSTLLVAIEKNQLVIARHPENFEVLLHSNERYKALALRIEEMKEFLSNTSALPGMVAGNLWKILSLFQLYNGWAVNARELDPASTDYLNHIIAQYKTVKERVQWFRNEAKQFQSLVKTTTDRYVCVICGRYHNRDWQSKHSKEAEAILAKAFQHCSYCAVACYCSKRCQLVHWEAGHKKHCNRLAKGRKAEQGK